MKNLTNFLQSLQDAAIPFTENESLKEHTSLKIGGPADIIARPSSIAQIQRLVELANEHQVPFAVLGNGSNTLVLDEGVQGLVILLKGHFGAIQLAPDHCIIAQAGASLMDVCRFALAHQLGGMEFAYGIPASVGGAIYMNAGAYGGEMKDIVTECTFLDENNEIVSLPIEQLDLRYRHSRFTDTRCIVLSATFQLHPADPALIEAQMNDYLQRRIAKQPLEYPSAGSTFKRPLNNYASALIDQCGLKGCQIGGAKVSEKHAGFLINANEATSRDMLDLIDHVKKVVFEKTGYMLECEMKILNGHRKC